MHSKSEEESWAELAREALQVQDACNLSGVVISFARVVPRVRALLEEDARRVGTEEALRGLTTTAVNRHPICQLWADKIASLTGTQFESVWSTAAYGQVEALSKGLRVAS